MNYQTAKVVFDVVDLPLPYNGILGRPALTKFMEVSHYAYNTLKMPGPAGVIPIPSDEKDAIICVDKMYRDTVTAEAAAAAVPTKENIGKKKDCMDISKESGKRVSSECDAPVDDLPESSNSKRSKVVAPVVRRSWQGWLALMVHSPISSTLDGK